MAKTLVVEESKEKATVRRKRVHNLPLSPGSTASTAARHKERTTAETRTAAGHISRAKLARKAVTEPQAAMSDMENPVVTAEERQQLIAESAYYRAERRGFATDDALIDWLEAEQDIDAMLNKPYGDTRD